MKKLIVSFLTVIMTSIVASAAGYRGFVNIGLGTTAREMGGLPLNFNTAHGVQLNKHLFLGAGVNLIYNCDLVLENDDYYLDVDKPFNISAFADLRYDIDITRRWSPFVECKIGYNIMHPDYYTNSYRSSILNCDPSRLFINPSIGVRLKLSHKCALNLGISYVPFRYKFVIGTNYRYDDEIHDYYEDIEKINTYKTLVNNLLVNFGVEF
ncbi:MAG: hypothetical protein K2G27_06035 [Duncaniella sp.]|nr:hypothetical protein [Duncaniella sp.]